MRITVKQLPCEQASFLAKFDNYKKAMEAHRFTIDVPAPFPEYEIFRVAWEQGESIEVYDDSPPAPPPLTLEQAAQRALDDKRAAALRALEDQRLAAALVDPLAPQAVKDYAVAAAVKP